ncbi:MAG: DUF294 nucleotidyltransferase-like domain-containing protein [Caldimicrobium sp.]|nr:DUF294 nucleotidyltransferase-like domain-containing protein [Caldimicrobium sp.]MCX7874523.1 DUF294 nucleotidyltransferase-like domain-containing protein [Caldimicrobium sp.]MDW8095031.1 putative nucleotidyltransferase substrate binding domain-containing protein [Caldimicrobium sp.]
MLDAERFLTEVEPFNSLSESEIRDLVSSLEVAYYKKDEVIYREGDKPLRYLYIIRSGVVVLEKEGEALEYLYEGHTFGYSSLLSKEPPYVTARSLDSTVVFLLPQEKFNILFREKSFIREYFTKKLSKGLIISKARITASSFEQHMDRSLEELELREVIILEGEKTVHEAVKEMVAKDSTYVFVNLVQGLGIVTERDVLKKVIAPGLDPQKVLLREIASFPLISIDSKASLYEAIVLMARHGIRKLLVIKEGSPVGVLEERDVILYESKNAITLIKEIDKAKTIEDIKYLYELLKDHVIEQIEQGSDPEKLARYISELNDRFMKRAVYFALERIREEPQTTYSILVLGSEGRREQSLKTDQDNALIYQDYKGESFNAAQYFERFSEEYIKVLQEIGFPPCPGGVMLNQPFWRRSLNDWKRTVESWIINPKPENTLRIAIFFDFRSIYGDERLVQELWNLIAETMRLNSTFARFLAFDAVNFKPPLGLFKEFVVEKSGEHTGELDIKKGGIFPIVQGVRALALENGIRAQNTFERIDELQRLNVLIKDYAKDLKEAYKFLLALRFKFQAQKIREKKEPDNYINPKNLSKAERNTLKDIFGFIRGFQDYLREKYKLMYL